MVNALDINLEEVRLIVPIVLLITTIPRSPEMSRPDHLFWFRSQGSSWRNLRQDLLDPFQRILWPIYTERGLESNTSCPQPFSNARFAMLFIWCVPHLIYSIAHELRFSHPRGVNRWFYRSECVEHGTEICLWYLLGDRTRFTPESIQQNTWRGMYNNQAALHHAPSDSIFLLHSSILLTRPPKFDVYTLRALYVGNPTSNYFVPTNIPHCAYPEVT